MMNLQLLVGLDANLFVVLHAVLEERSATRAAKRLHVTQSAISNALARLRAALGDPLVVRSGRGLVPTPHAMELAPLIAQALHNLETAAARGRPFDPKASTRTFTLAAADNHQTSEVPRIAAAFAKQLPHAALRIVSADYLAASDGLASGEIDLAMTPTALVTPTQRHEAVFVERATFVVRRDHPKVRGKMTPKLFNEVAHIDVEVALGRKGIGHRLTEDHWKRAGLERKVAATVPYFTTAAMLAARTDYVAAMPSSLAEVLCGPFPLAIVKTTFPLPTIGISIVWHERTEADSGARFFRELVMKAVRRRGVVG